MRQQSDETPLQTNAMHLTPRVRPLLPVFSAKGRTYAYHRPSARRYTARILTSSDVL
jgi:hypothetical protein